MCYMTTSVTSLWIFIFVTCYGNAGGTTKVMTSRVGEIAVLPCDVTISNDPHVIEWIKANISVPIYIKITQRSPHVSPEFKDRISVAGSWDLSLRITDIAEYDEGLYACRILKFDGSGFTQARNGSWTSLVVTAPPSFTVQPQPIVRKLAGESLKLDCMADGKPFPEITWLKEGSPIKNLMNNVQISDSGLFIPSVTSQHRGRYTCRVQSVEGQIQANTIVYVQAPPTFTTRPSDTTSAESEDVSFTCEAEGYPSMITYRWLYNNRSINDVARLKTRHSLVGDRKLYIYNVAKEDTGVITCVVDNGYGKAQTSSAKLTVQYKARVRSMPSVHYGGLDLATTLDCPAEAEPPVNMVEWRRDGLLIHIQQDVRYSTNQDGSLVIRKTLSRDGGRYTCKPFNLLGSQGESSGMMLLVKDPPYLTIVPKSQYEAKIGEQIGIKCAGDGDPQPKTKWEKVDDTTVRYKDIRGRLMIDSVSAQHHGVWRCIVSNNIATVSKDVTLLVKYTSPHPVVNLQARALSGSSVLIKWLPGYNGGYKQTFDLWYKNVLKNDWLSIAVVGNKSEIILTNLNPNTEYEISVLPTNRLGSGEFSKTVHAKTFATVNKPTSITISKPQTPQNLYVIVNQRGLLQLFWRQPSVKPVSKYSSEDDGNKVLVGYLVEYRQIGVDSTSSGSRRKKRSSKENLQILFRTKRRSGNTNQEWKALKTARSNETSIVLNSKDLHRDRIYEFRVLAFSNNAYSVPSNSVKMSTRGLTAYPFYTSTMNTASINNPVLFGVLGGICFMALFIIIIFVILCKRKYFKKKRRNTNGGTLQSMKQITANEMKARPSYYERHPMRVDIPMSDSESDEKPLLDKLCRSNYVYRSDVKPSYSADQISNFNCRIGSMSDRSSVRIRRETVARVLEEQLKRRSLNEQMKNKIYKNSLYRGGIRSAETSPERPYNSPHSIKERLNVTDPGVIEDKPTNRKYYTKYAQPIYGTDKEKMVVFSRKSIRKITSESLTPSRASSESPVFGVIGMSHNISPIHSAILEESSSSNDGRRRHMISARSNAVHNAPAGNRSFSPCHASPYSPTILMSPLEDSVFGSPSYSSKIPPRKYTSWNPGSASSPKDENEKVSPNRVVERRTIAYNDEHTPCKPLQRNTASLNRSFMKPSRMTVFHPNRRTSRSNEDILDSSDHFDGKRKSWAQRNVYDIRQKPAKTRNSYSVGNTSMSVYRPSQVPTQRVTSPPFRPPEAKAHRMEGTSGRRPSQAEPNIEIDCSNSDIEVRIFDRGQTQQQMPNKFVYGREMVNRIDRSSMSPTRGYRPHGHAYRNPNVSSPPPGGYEFYSPRHSPHKTATGSPPPHLPCPTNQQDTSKEGVYKTVSPTIRISSSGYDSQNTSNNSTSPPGGQISVIERNSRKETSSVEDNYEWDSELAMEKEILEALRHFGTHKKDGPLSEELLSELNKFTRDRKLMHGSKSPSSADNYSKENIAQRCAALRAEFLHYQEMQQLDDVQTTSP